MQKQPPLTNKEGEVRELTTEDISLFKPAADILPPETLQKLVGMRGMRGPQKSPTKVATTIRFDADILSQLKASGKGWQTRVNDAVREWLKTHPPA